MTAKSLFNLYRTFVESLDTSDALFKEAILDGLDELLSTIRSDSQGIMTIKPFNILRDFIESLPTDDALFKEAILGGLDEFLSTIRSNERNEGIESENEFFTDPRDNKKYRVVKIGNQTWMAENLNWAGAGVMSRKKYGRLYTWNEAMESAPAGWHLPTDWEWQQLVDFAGAGAGGAKNAATALKSEDWDGDDRFGFSALPGGYFNKSNAFLDVGHQGMWWSAAEGSIPYFFAYYRGMHSGDAKVIRFENRKDFALSVRLIQDSPPAQGKEPV